ncbi:hypothetical protein ILUMI_16328 [Ignelater luminosus]|uniref:Peptidase S1 domain-containing protein n=1 Tax=Ignelater luminosus TaxID=2038154 RepID=A0A8K0G302_IGNLU|nr:hypothetical protein ILUMI_16328 [Ignelater luminosus]
MNFYITLLLAAVSALDSSAASPLTSFAPKVIGGSNAKRHEFPYMVSIQPLELNDHRCGGSIISSRWIVTAAHYDLDNDVALIELTTALQFTDAVKPIALPLVNQTFTSGLLIG